MSHRSANKHKRDSLQAKLAAILKSSMKSAESGAVPVPQVRPKVSKTQDPDLYYQKATALKSKLRSEGISSSFAVNIALLKLFSSGELHFRTESWRGNHHQFIRLFDSVPTLGCSCEESDGELPCEHLLSCAEWLCVNLKHERASIRSRIREGNFDREEPDYSKIKIDRGLQVLESMKNLIKVVSPYRPVDVNLSDASAQKATEERVVWRLEGIQRNLEITPLIQSKKKTGSGFTKGKRVSVENLILRYSQCLNEREKELLSNLSDSRPARSAEISPYAALGYLVGSDRVLYEDQPIAVVEKPILFATSVSEVGFDFCVLDGTHVVHKSSIVLIYNAAVYRNKERNEFVLLRFPTGLDSQRVHDLLSLPPVAKHHLQAFIENAKELQKRFPLKLPQDIVGQFVEDPGKPMLLLRARADGQLDFGLRMKIQSGLICLPASEPAVYLGEHNGKKVQWYRDAQKEVAVISSLADRLGVEAPAWNDYSGTIASFEDGIRLLEKIEECRDQVEILWDKQSEKPIRMAGTITAKSLRVDISSKRNWFGVTGECQLDTTAVPLEKLLENLQGTPNPMFAGFVQVGDGQWARIEAGLREKLELLRDATHVDRKQRAVDATGAMAIQALTQADVEVKANKSWQQCMERFAKANCLDPELPKGLRAELREYQIEGFKWLRRLAEWGVGGVLADDMGLGKTLQTLAVLLDRASEGPSLVIAPTSVGFNWIRETERFAPDLNVMAYRESDRQEILAALKPGDVVVASYALAWRDEAQLSQVEWGTLVMDEAQAVKNARSKTSQAVSNFNSKWSIALTGTPMENHLGELWSLFSVVSPGVLGGWETFRQRFATPIERQSDPEARLALSKRLKPFILRRTKEEVLTELPPRTESVLYVDLSPEERSQYELVRRSAIGEIENLALLPDIKDQRFKILALLTRLRQFACHPGIVNKAWNRSSAKLDQLCETLGSLKEEGHRALIFSQFTEHLSLIRKSLDERGFTYQYLDGSTPAAERQQRVDNFQNGTDTAFLISLKAGGTGLNLTAADYVIHMDPWWNPAVEDQATDRAHRFGQDKPVMVYRIVAKGTIEEEILALHEHKRDLVEDILDGTGAAAKLSTTELMQLIQSH
jgi:superfamily II DNA or RNA helicase